MLQIKNLTVSYGEAPILKQLNLEVETGETVTIVGPSGCGKSTLLKAIAQLIQIDEGSILFNNQDLNLNTHTVGYIPQNFGLLPWKTVEQNIVMALKLKNLPLMIDNVPVVDTALERIGLLNHKKKYPLALSGGQKQRVAIARSFVLQPDILLMDEPFSALDSWTKEEMQQFFISLRDGKKASTLFITHDIEEAVLLGDKVVLMLPNQPIKILTSTSKNRDDVNFVKLCSQIRKSMKRGIIE